MNVEELIYQMKKRPGMYVGCIQLEPVVHFINGFMLNNVVTGKIDSIEEFRKKFDDWVKEQLENKYNIELEKYHNYLFYITQVSRDSEEGLKMFFELSENFFREVHEKYIHS